MTQARQWWVLVRYKDEAGAGFGMQYVTATNAYEAVQMAKALYGKLLILRVQNSSFDKLQTMTYGYLKSALGPVVVVPFCAQSRSL
jgi:hypothetical protein